MNELTNVNVISRANNWLKRCCISLIIVVVLPIFAAGDINVDTSNGLAIHGYDPVAYFVSNKPEEGKPELIYGYQGNKWSFANEKNKQAFIANPDAYIPQYGGHCAFAASQNAIANTDPYAWTIHNKKLYLNYSIGTRSLWLKDKDKLIIAADGYWPQLAKQVSKQAMSK